MKKIITLCVCAAMVTGIAIGAAATHLKDFSFREIVLQMPKDPLVQELGRKPGSEWTGILEIHHAKRAIDPMSVQIEVQWDKAAKGGFLDVLDPNDNYWTVPYTVNLKNRMGGYNGPVARYAYFKNEKFYGSCESVNSYRHKTENYTRKLQSGEISVINALTLMPKAECIREQPKP